jgi:hypothetical protein
MIHLALVAAEIFGLILVIAGWIWASRSMLRRDASAQPTSAVRRVVGIAEHQMYAAILVFMRRFAEETGPANRETSRVREVLDDLRGDDEVHGVIEWQLLLRHV